MTRSRLTTLTAALLGGASLAACASTDTAGRVDGLGPSYPTAPAPRTAEAAPPAVKPPVAAPPRTAGLKVGKPYQIKGVWYTPREQPDYDEVGIASWYGGQFHLRQTASGEIFDMYMPSAAHKTLPLNSVVEVINLENGRKIQVRVNDRGPFIEGRIIDLSMGAAEELGMTRAGVARVRVRYVGPASAKRQPPIVVASAAPAPARSEALAPIGAGFGTAAKPVALAAATPPSAPAAASLGPLAPIGAGFGVAPKPVQVATLDPLVSEPILVEIGRSSLYEVQVGAFADRGNAERVASRLTGAGDVVIRPAEGGSGAVYRVVVHRLDSQDAAFQVKDRLASLGFPDARVMRAF